MVHGPTPAWGLDGISTRNINIQTLAVSGVPWPLNEMFPWLLGSVPPPGIPAGVMGAGCDQGAERGRFPAPTPERSQTRGDAEQGCGPSFAGDVLGETGPESSGLPPPRNPGQTEGTVNSGLYPQTLTG